MKPSSVLISLHYWRSSLCSSLGSANAAATWKTNSYQIVSIFCTLERKNTFCTGVNEYYCNFSFLLLKRFFARVNDDQTNHQYNLCFRGGFFAVMKDIFRNFLWKENPSLDSTQLNLPMHSSLLFRSTIFFFRKQTFVKRMNCTQAQKCAWL